MEREERAKATEPRQENAKKERETRSKREQRGSKEPMSKREQRRSMETSSKQTLGNKVKPQKTSAFSQQCITRIQSFSRYTNNSIFVKVKIQTILVSSRKKY